MANSGLAQKRLLKQEDDVTKVEFETGKEVDVTPTFDVRSRHASRLRRFLCAMNEGPPLARPTEGSYPARAAAPLLRSRDEKLSFPPEARLWRTHARAVTSVPGGGG
ncbi:Eukaryotic initiation factor 4A-III [Myotis davidii]|uniref:Eukaryotic initiation factor 4A-III n=1 Tax=Myotis davidii TaxID=225400 RepID=L5LXC6_MYODS|nr:Eukaryotic initiation factor 4A-III [Myotis davidii]